MKWALYAVVMFEALLRASPVCAQDVKIFCLMGVDADSKAASQCLNDPQVTGISWRFSWRALEPGQGQYNWAPIDQALTLSKRKGKLAMLRVTAGIMTPGWVYQAGAKPVEFSNKDLHFPQNWPDKLKMPVPWDGTYLARWQSFIQALGSRYDSDPSIYSVQMTGGGWIGEMNLPKCFAQWQQAGYSPQKLTAAWERIMDAYQRSFPHVPTNLDINEPLGNWGGDVLNPVVSYAVASYPGKVYLQQDGLRADFPKGSPIRVLLRAASERTIVGYQMLGGEGWLGAQTGDRALAFQHAREDHASYVEVYARDIADPALRPALRYLMLGGSPPTDQNQRHARHHARLKLLRDRWPRNWRRLVSRRQARLGPRP